MPKNWYFSRKGDGKIEAVCGAYATDAAGNVTICGDAWRSIEVGGNLDGVPHDELLAAGAGVLQIHGGGRHKIVTSKRPAKRPRKRKGL
jgi:hypothetical protein